MAAPASDAGIFLHMVYDTMQQMGLDCAAIFASINLPDSPPDPNARRINSPQRRFWRSAEQVSANPDIGLHVGERLPPFRGQVLEYLFLSSPTFGDGLQRALRYRSLLTSALPLSLRIEGETAILAGLEHDTRHYIECATCILLTFCRVLTDGEFTPSLIRFRHAQGATAEEYQRALGCPVLLNQEAGELHFPVSLLARPSPTAEPQLLALHETLAEQRLAELSRHEMVYRVERELGNLLEAGEVKLETVARRLNKNPRTLRADLTAAGMPFNEIVSRYRERLARRLLARTNEPLDQIIYLTGFSEPAAFARAFKRWTGETPTAYRRRKQRTDT